MRARTHHPPTDPVDHLVGATGACKHAPYGTRPVRALALASRAVIPVPFRNARLNADSDPNPVRTATSLSGTPVSVTSRRAAASLSPA